MINEKLHFHPNIQSPEKYEFLVFKRNKYRNELEKAFDIVKKYIIENKLILTGGMAIDFALRKRGSKLYDENAMPDYDFYSPNFQNDAYAIGKKLCLMGLTNVSVINATHDTTMRVRVNFEPVADITYIPTNLYKIIPTIKNKDGIIFEHPHYKMINIHTALSYPYKNSPFDVILQRFGKDMKRFDMLYELYPIEDGNIKLKEKLITSKIDKSLLIGECLAGFPALCYWISQFSNNKTVKKDLSGDLTQKTCGWEIKDNEVEFRIPESSLITILSDNPTNVQTKIEKQFKNQNDILFQNYNKLLDNIPAKISVKFSKRKSNFNVSDIDILDNRGNMTAAINIGEFWIANPQFIMSQFLTKNIMYDESKENKIKYIWGYLKCFELVKNAGDRFKLLEKNEKKSPQENIDIFPTYKTYGEYNINKSNIVIEHKILEKIGERKLRLYPERPIPEYPTLKDNCKIRDIVKKFEVDKSWLFEIDGSKRDLPLQFIVD